MRYRPDSLEGRFLAGDQDAHAEVLRWIARVLTLPRFITLRLDWKDLLQDVLKRVVESLRTERFDPSLDFRVYVQSIARYAAAETIHRRIRRRAATAKDEAAATADVEDRLVAKATVESALSRVGSVCRRILHLFYFEQRSHAEIAETLEIPIGTVKSRLFRCLQRVRQQIEARP